MPEHSARWPAAALVDALRGRTVVDGYCDGEGVDDVHLRLDDGTRIELGPRGRLLVAVERPSRPR